MHIHAHTHTLTHIHAHTRTYRHIHAHTEGTLRHVKDVFKTCDTRAYVQKARYKRTYIQRRRYIRTHIQKARYTRTDSPREGQVPVQPVDPRSLHPPTSTHESVPPYGAAQAGDTCLLGSDRGVKMVTIADQDEVRFEFGEEE